MSYGHSNQLHTAKVLRLSENLPIVIEIEASQETIEAFLPALDEMMRSDLVTVSPAQHDSNHHPL